jgi:hypothetical protein
MFTRAVAHRGREPVSPAVPGGLEEVLRRGGDRLGVHGPRAGATGREHPAVLQSKAGLGVLAVPPDRGGELAGLGVSEQVRAVDPEPVQVGLHSPRGRPGLCGRIDPHQHDVGVGLGGRNDVGVGLGDRTCAAVARAIGWLRDHGHLETRAGDVVPAAETHPDVVLMGVDAPAETRAASGRMQAYLHRLGVHRPDLLGHAEARKLAASIWWHRQHAETRLGLQDRRVLATGRACPGAMYAKAIAATPKHLLETAWYCRRDGFSATVRHRAGEHSRATTVSPGDALYNLGGDGVTVRCGSPAGPVPSRGGEPERPRHDRHRGGPAGPGRRRDGHASAQLDGAGAQGRVLAAVPAPSARQAGRPGRHPRSPHQAARPAAEDPR